MTTQLIIARHGNTFSPGDTVTRVGITDLPLVESGLKQGRQLGVYLQENRLIPDVIFTSKLKRTIQTAEQAQLSMQTHLPTETLAIFNEIDYGPDENQPETQVVARLGKETLSAWESLATVPNGWKIDPQDIINSWLNFAEMIEKKYTGKTILVVTSNGIARFAPYLTGDFPGFAAKHGIKLATGALALFQKEASSKIWLCQQWNARPVIR